MRRVFIPIAFFVSLNIAFAEYEYTEGWTPIPNEEVYRRFNFNAQKVNNVQRIDLPWYQNIDLFEESVAVNKNEAIKLVEPQKLYDEFTANKLKYSTEKVYTGVNEKLLDGKKHNEIETSNSKNIRKAKKIDEHNYDIVYSNTIPHSKERHSDNDDNVEEKTKENETNTYEVTQKSEATDLEPIKVDTKSGYVYSLPEIKSHQFKNNLTYKFLNILDKYNINDKDKLTNYAKSRISSTQDISKPRIVYLPIPLRFLETHNSLNHLSVDPLMAVFLSNYGYYLPYTYGIHNNYRNLYGYLASNNIHNNKPFGNYKLFSDTDSSS